MIGQHSAKYQVDCVRQFGEWWPHSDDLASNSLELLHQKLAVRVFWVKYHHTQISQVAQQVWSRMLHSTSNTAFDAGFIHWRALTSLLRTRLSSVV